jgi:hypothetical protein
MLLSGQQRMFSPSTLPPDQRRVRGRHRRRNTDRARRPPQGVGKIFSPDNVISKLVGHEMLGLFDWPRAGDEDIHQSPGALLPVRTGCHIGDAYEGPE